MIEEIVQYLVAGALLLIACTFAIGAVKTFIEGPEAFAELDRAGFTLKNFWNGSVPHYNSVTYQSTGAEIWIENGVVHARPTGTMR